MVKYEGIVIHFGEIWLKGKNRGSFVGLLYNNIKSALEGEHYSKLENVRDRFYLVLDKNSNAESISGKLSKVFGISWFAPVITVENDPKAMLKAANTLLGKSDTVRIVPHRALKSFSFNSSDIVTHFIKNSDKLKFKIDKDSEKDLYISVTKDFSFMYHEKVQGAKGLPVGSSGKCVVLLSGGIDSPVAAFYAMKRGLKPIYMHVHAFQNNEDERLSKIAKITKLLSEYSGSSKVYYMPGHVFQSAAMRTPKKYELVLFKLFMYKMAEKIMKKEDADCIVSGESLGQVASQTTSNLTTSQHGIKPFIMRPVIGFDKQEIINVAKRIGTFDASIIKYKDVCSIAALNPATSTDYKTIGAFWKSSSMNDAMDKTMKRTSSTVI